MSLEQDVKDKLQDFNDHIGIMLDMKNPGLLLVTQFKNAEHVFPMKALKTHRAECIKGIIAFVTTIKIEMNDTSDDHQELKFMFRIASREAGKLHKKTNSMQAPLASIPEEDAIDELLYTKAIPQSSIIQEKKDGFFSKEVPEQKQEIITPSTDAIPAKANIPRLKRCARFYQLPLSPDSDSAATAIAEPHKPSPDNVF